MDESGLADIVGLVLVLAIAVAAIGALWLRVMRRRCPDCMSWVDNRSTRCRHCGNELS